MNTDKNIRYFAHNKIHKNKWDECIQNSVNGIVYATSWYLDLVCENWDALIEGDYESVMPLTHAKKLGVRYLFKPQLSQQLGIFSIKSINNNTINRFLRAIPGRFRFININLNISNHFDNNEWEIKVNNNFLVDLSQPYKTLYSKFNKNTRRNIKRAKLCSLSIREGVIPEDLLRLKKSNPIGKLTDSYYNMLEKVITTCINNKSGRITGVYSSENTLLAAVFFLSYRNSAIYLISASSNEGKEKRAMFMLINHFIEKNAGTNLFLDFEGSNIPSLAMFFGGFGGEAFKYLTIKQNRLPWFTKWLKK